MTPEQMKTKSLEKMQLVNSFLNKMGITIKAVQAINDEGIIENKIVFTDTEKYPQDKPEVQADTAVTTDVIPEANEEKKDDVA